MSCPSSQIRIYRKEKTSLSGLEIWPTNINVISTEFPGGTGCAGFLALTDVTRYIEIEFEPPSESRSECCGNTTTRLTCFVYRDGDAYAIYYVGCTPEHDEERVSGLIGLGEWGKEGGPADRLAFFGRPGQLQCRPVERGRFPHGAT